MKTKHVVAAIIEKEGKILLARRAPGEHSAGLWEFPGGKQEPGESLQQSLEREIYEEFEVNIKAGQLFCRTETVVDDFYLILYALKAVHLKGDFIPIVHDKIAWVSPEALSEYKVPEPDRPIIEKLIQTPLYPDDMS